MKTRRPALIAIGSNVGQRIDHVRWAEKKIASLHHCRLLFHTSLYKTTPIGTTWQMAYINALLIIETGLTPQALLRQLQALERRRGRIRKGIHWGPRVLDLDIVLYDDINISEENLLLPHPGWPERSFWSIPALEFSGLKIARAWLKNRPKARMRRVGIQPVGRF